MGKDKCRVFGKNGETMKRETMTAPVVEWKPKGDHGREGKEYVEEKDKGSVARSKTLRQVPQ